MTDTSNLATGNYAFSHEGKGFRPDGTTIPDSDVLTHNQALEQAQLAELRTGPDRVFLYVKLPGDVAAWQSVSSRQTSELNGAAITIWTGLVVATHVLIGPRREFPCFGPFPSRRRAVECRIFGVRYVGWYFESSGDYCRLKKAKRQ